MGTILEGIYSSGVKFLFPLTRKKTYVTVVEDACKLVGAEYGSLYLRHGRRLVRVYTTSPVGLRLKPKPQGNTYKCARTKRILVLGLREIVKTHPEFVSSNIRSVTMIPLVYRNRSIGVLNLQSKTKNYFSAYNLSILKLFSALASLTIYRLELYFEAKNALRTRDLFISMASHELKTPLTIALAYAQLIKKKVREKKAVEVESVVKLERSLVTMNNLVKYLLQANQIKSGRLVFERNEVDIRSVVSQALENFTIMYPNRRLHFEDLSHPSQKTMIKGDHTKLVQVIENVLFNAAKYSPSNTPVSCEFKHLEDGMHIIIKDRGVGIPRKDLKKVFNKYYRSSSSTEEGMGIGLYLVKKIVEKHKGSITIQSELKKGTQVDIFLPHGG